MAWFRHAATIGNELKSLHAGIAQDVVRNNLNELAANGPAFVGHQIENDNASPLQSAIQAGGPYQAGHVFWRDAHTFVRHQATPDHALRGIHVIAELRRGGVATGGTVRLVSSPQFKLPGDYIWTSGTPVDPDFEDEDAAIGAAYAWHEFKIPLLPAHTVLSSQGTSRIDRGPISYHTVDLFMQGYTDTYGQRVECRRLTVGEYEF